MNDEIAVPAALIKLEQLRVRSSAHLAQVRELTDRRNELGDQIKALRQDIDRIRSTLSRPVRGLQVLGTRMPHDAIESKQKTIAVLAAMQEVVQRAYDELQQENGDGQLYDSTKRHLIGELHAWGLS